MSIIMIPKKHIRFKIIDADTRRLINDEPSKEMALLAYSSSGNFLGECDLTLIDEKKRIIEVQNVVARPGHGDCLHKLVLQFAAHIGGHALVARNGDVVPPELRIWDDIYDSTDKLDLCPIPKDLMGSIVDIYSMDEHPSVYYSYSIPVDDDFYRSRTLIDPVIDEIYKFVREKSDSYFALAYSEESNKFIDLEDPIVRTTRKNFLLEEMA